MGPSAASFTLEDLTVGQSAAFEVLVSGCDVDRFAAVSGDQSPLHTDAAFARQRGFRDRVAHGAYLLALASRLAGMFLPGENALLLAVNFSFSAPVLVGTRVTVSGVIDQVSDSVRSIILKMRIMDASTHEALARGKLTIGFTSVGGPEAGFGHPAHG